MIAYGIAIFVLAVLGWYTIDIIEKAEAREAMMQRRIEDLEAQERAYWRQRCLRK